MEVTQIFILCLWLACANCMRMRPISQFNAIRRNSTFNNYAENIQFLYYNKRSDLVKVSKVDKTDDDYFEVDNCVPGKKFAILVHGWMESCSQEWVRMLIKNLNKYRGGCIICMDYTKYSKQEYPRLIRSFDAITQILSTKLFQMEELGFRPTDGYMFGFSYGAQLVSEAARRFGTRKLKEVDLCDIAGPGFDYKSSPEHKYAASNVQCIHTSSDKGTRHSTCDQNWKMGKCGSSQSGARDPPFGSHGLCPYFYNYAFEFIFPAVPKPRDCNSKRAAGDWPDGFRMGYMERRKKLVHGELFAITTAHYPFTPFTYPVRLFGHANDSSETTQQIYDEHNSIF